MTPQNRSDREALIRVTFTSRERSLLAEHTFADPDRLVETAGQWVAGFSVSELDDILGFVAAAANHARRAKLRDELDALYDRLEPIVEADGGDAF